MAPVLPKVAEICTRHPRRVLWAAVLLTLPALAVTATLGISTSRTALVSEDSAYWKRYMDFAREFGIPEDLVVVVRADAPAQVRSFTDAVAARLAAQPDQVKAVFHRVDLTVFEDRAPLFLDDGVLEILGTLADTEAVAQIRAHSQADTRIMALARLMEAVPKVIGDTRVSTESELMATALERLLVQLRRFVLEGATEPITLLDRDAAMEAAVGTKREGALDARGYLTTDHGKTGVMFVRPVYTRDEMAVVVPFVQAVRSACAAEQAAHPEVQFGLTGIPASEVDELETITHDTVLTSIIALLGVVGLFMLYFPALRLLLYSLVPVLFGTIWTAAYIRIAFGYVNLMSSIFLVILIGMGIDFSVHIASRFLEQRRLGDAPPDAARIAVSCAGRGVLTGAVTSAGAFAAVGWCGFKGIEELGLAASVGLLATVVAALTVFPAILALAGHRLPNREAKTASLQPLVHLVAQGRWFIIVGVLVLTVPLGALALKTPFDFSLLNLLPAEAESARLMAEMIDNRDLSANAAAIPVASLDQAREMEDKLRALDSVYSVVSAASFLPPHQEKRLAALQQIKERLKAALTQTASTTPTPPGLEAAVSELEASVERLSELAFSGGQSGAVDHLERGLDAVVAVRKAIEDDQAPGAEAGAQAYGRELAEVINGLCGRLNRVLEAGELDARGLPANLRQRFVSPGGRFAVYAVPKNSIWDREALGTFIHDVRSVAPEVTGFPETFYENTGLIQRGFLRASMYASLAVFILLWIDLRRLRYVFIALIPVALGAVWMLGWMHIAQIPYNLANIVGLPLIIGVGIDNGVHVLHRYLETHSVETATVKTGGAVLLSSLTTMVGFGSLAFASHRGYSSLGQILFLGVGACLLMALTVLPSVLAIAHDRLKA